MKRTVVLIVTVAVLVICMGGLLLFGFSDRNSGNHSGDKKTSSTKEEPVTVTIGSAGDIILHDPFIKNPVYRSEGEYDYSKCFEEISGIYNSFDYMVVNLETTLAGKEAGYRGYPVFNSPEVIAANLKESGVDMFLQANNHIYDSGKDGFLHTGNYLKDNGYSFTGIRTSEEEDPYLIENIKGIKVGFINYTYETPYSGGKAVNANLVDESVAPLLNSFDPADTEKFYAEFESRVKEMRDKGAQFIIFYPHWGNEYELKQCDYQEEMAQRLCNMGVDAIIGSHPHVVQPVSVITSENGKHEMFCAYSMGNQLSNQRRAYIPMMSDGHTEDGIIFSLEITRDENGETSLTGVSYIPTWVSMESGSVHCIVPADGSDDESAKSSKSRTDSIVGEGMKQASEVFENRK